MFFLFYRLDGYSLVGSIAGAIIGGSIAGVINGALLSPLGYLIAIGVNAAITKIRNSKIDLENREISADNDVIIAQSDKRADLIRVEIKKANQKYMETKDVLAQFYSKGIVYQKYHGLVPITMFCEYIASGRCTTLTGHEGAYNIYENEIRLDLILTKLDDIIEQLKQIKQRQYMLADLIEKSNREITKLTKIVLPDMLKTIGNGAFGYCQSLSDISGGANIEFIGDNAFSYCSAIKSFHFSSNTTEIGSGVFSGCSALESVSFPEENILIGENQFAEGCTSLLEIRIAPEARPRIYTITGNISQSIKVIYYTKD